MLAAEQQALEGEQQLLRGLDVQAGDQQVLQLGQARLAQVRALEAEVELR